MSNIIYIHHTSEYQCLRSTGRTLTAISPENHKNDKRFTHLFSLCATFIKIKFKLEFCIAKNDLWNGLTYILGNEKIKAVNDHSVQKCDKFLTNEEEITGYINCPNILSKKLTVSPLKLVNGSKVYLFMWHIVAIQIFAMELINIYKIDKMLTKFVKNQQILLNNYQ